MKDTAVLQGSQAGPGTCRGEELKRWEIKERKGSVHL